MPSTLPDGEPVPDDGALPAAALDELRARAAARRSASTCTSRSARPAAGTATSTPTRRPSSGRGAAARRYAAQAVEELRLARRVLGDTELPVATVFFGGGTPTLLPAGDLADVLGAIDDLFGLAAGAEVTTEANPDSVTAHSLGQLRAAGFTRVTSGCSPPSPHVLATLDRTHRPENVATAVRAARDAGFDQVSLDLIYGTAGESAEDWQASLDTALELEPDHLSAYALVVEDGTRLAGQVRRGEVPAPDDDDLADKYAQADATLAAGGLSWYEVSNWAARHRRVVPAQPRLLAGRRLVGGGARRAQPCRWRPLVERQAPGRLRGADRAAAISRVRAGGPRRAAARDRADAARRAPGRGTAGAGDVGGSGVVDRLVADGLVEEGAGREGRLRLTLRGRLLADAVVRELVP